jgi:hypothetical protein
MRMCGGCTTTAPRRASRPRRPPPSCCCVSRTCGSTGMPLRSGNNVLASPAESLPRRDASLAYSPPWRPRAGHGNMPAMLHSPPMSPALSDSPRVNLPKAILGLSIYIKCENSGGDFVPR